MSVRASVAPFGVGLGVAALAGAAQLGVAYGLGMLLWNQRYDASGTAWANNLTWACWLAAVSVVAGAVAGGRLLPPHARGVRGSRAQRLGMAFAAGVGGSLTVLLVAVPSRHAQLPAVEPVVTAGRTAVIGVIVGVLLAVLVLAARPLAWNALAVVAWLWLLAVVAVGMALRNGADPIGPHLGVWGGPGGGSGWTPVLVPMVTSAVILGFAVAMAARRAGANRLVVATCGAPGPLLVAIAYLVAGPGSWGERGPQFYPYLVAPYAVLAGLLGSLLVVAFDRTGTATPDATHPEASTQDSTTATAPEATSDDATAAALPSAGDTSSPTATPAPATSTETSDETAAKASTKASAKTSTRSASATKTTRRRSGSSSKSATDTSTTASAKAVKATDSRAGDSTPADSSSSDSSSDESTSDDLADWPAQLREPDPGRRRPRKR